MVPTIHAMIVAAGGYRNHTQGTIPIGVTGTNESMVYGWYTQVGDWGTVVPESWRSLRGVQVHPSGVHSTHTHMPMVVPL